MHNQIRRFATLLITLLAVGGCEQVDPAASGFPEGGLRIAFLPPVTMTPEWKYVVAGARKYVSDRGQIEISEVSSDAYQSNLAEAIGFGTDREPHAVVLGVWHGPQTRPVAQALLNLGIPVLTYGNRVELDGIYGHVQVQRLDGAEELAHSLREVVAPKQSFLLVHNSKASEFDQELYNRFHTTANTVFDVKRLREHDAYEQDVPPLQLAERMLDEFPNAGLIVSLTANSWTDASHARIKELPCRVALLTAVPTTWRWLRFGQAAAIVGGVDGEGGQKVAALAISAATRSARAPLFDTLATEVVTEANMDNFIERYAASIGEAPGPLAETGALSAPK